MKAFFQRLHLSGGAKDKDKDSPLAKEKFPPLRSWPPDDPQRATPTPSSFASYKPLPEISVTNRPLPPIEGPAPSQVSSSTPTPPYSSPSQPPIDSISPDHTNRPASPRTELDSTARSSRKVANGTLTAAAANDVQKKVAFISPPPTPVNADRTLSPDTPTATQPATQPASQPQTTLPLKTTVSRFQAAHGKEPRVSVSTAASSSKTDVATTTNKTSAKATSTRAASPYLQKQAEGASAPSLRSGTPYSQMSTGSGSRILAATSWSEVTEEDLVSNLGSRERTRQEVLFEIISSEERYVQELIKMKDTFIDPLMHPFSTSTVAASPLSSTPNLDYDYYRSESPSESGDHLPPIAARFMSPSPSGPPPSAGTASIRIKETPNIDGESLETDEDDEGDGRPGRGYNGRVANPASKADHPRSPYRGTSTNTNGRTGASVPFPSRSHMSLPPPPRNQLSASTHSLGRQSTAVEADRARERKHSQGDTSQRTGVLRKFKKSQTSPSAIFGDYVAPHQLPEDLRVCLEVVDSGVLDGHKRLSEALKKRYDDQYPLVRSLADVFVSNSDIFQGYAKYVLHLERALEQVDAALHNVSTKKPKKQDAAEWQKVCKVLQKLEEDACDKGETGLAITLSKPFQRLLKYPLLFQNLLFHTDPSTFEYESTLQMVAEVETIVRSIEDEKIQKEERDKTRDVFARIEGLDKVKQLALPKPSRVLVEERQCTPGPSSPPKPSSPPPVVNSKGVRGKSSFKRLSDVLHSGNNGIGGKKDLWFVVFNDVVLQCQRTGTTSLPLVSATTSRTNSLPELQGKAKYATTGRRNVHTKPRNLYKFIKIETWAIGDVMQPREGVVSMEDVVRSRAQAHTQPRIVPLPPDDEDGNSSDDSDKKSKMSFSYWGADKVTVQKPIVKGKAAVTPRRGGAAASYGRESSANAKFGTRLVSGDGSPSARPASRRTQAVTPTSRRAPLDDSPNYAKATVTRPAWGAGAGSPAPPPSKRSRNTSQTSAATKVAIPAKAVGSPAPSEDSGVGLYRQMLAQDPSLNNA
ncbi:putative protein with domain-containing protein [Lyophyllum shimeji]|uniref:DH domain-containing protein n=1 Tax=Lyophyllum shimeji TaxID=47721 RepID=A0A9P3PFQ6_LYOSH|nr:putative protein with domain-containing protein [Lyophyllum shimeji]